MASLSFQNAFSRYGGKLKNVQWAVSALTERELIVSLWAHKIKNDGGRWTYRDSLARWSGAGRNLFAEHLAVACADQRPVRVVLAHTDDHDAVERGDDGKGIKKTFSVKLDRVGRVTLLSGDDFEIVFEAPLKTAT